MSNTSNQPKELNIKEFFAALQQVANHNLMNIEEVKQVIREAVFKSFHTKFDPDAELTMNIDEKTQQFELINKTKLIVEDQEFEAQYRAMEVPLSAAQKVNPSAKVGDVFAEVVDFSSYSKAISQQIRQMITQSVREHRKEAIWEKHQFLKGQTIDVVVQSVAESFVIFVLDDQTTAFMPSKLRNYKIPLHIGERTKVFVEDVLKESRDSQIIVSNGSPLMIRRLLELEVPEIASEQIEVVNIARIAGERSKVAVRSKQPNVDAIGSIIGNEGSRINAITTKLGGEKIDVVLHDEDANVFIANALAPARIISVIDKKDTDNNIIKNYKIAITPNRHQTLAIGRGGLNVRLAVELTNFRLDVLSLDEAKKQLLEFPWNGNVSPTEVEAIEAGEKVLFRRNQRPNGRFGNNNFGQNNFRPGQNNNFGRNQGSTFNSDSKISSSLFDDDISSFKNEINVDRNNDFKVDDSFFSEEELRQMEANFELNDGVDNFEEENDDNKDFNLYNDNE